MGIPTTSPEKLIEQIQIIMNDESSMAKWTRRKNQLLENTIDVTAFWSEYFEEYVLNNLSK